MNKQMKKVITKFFIALYTIALLLLLSHSVSFGQDTKTIFATKTPDDPTNYAYTYRLWLKDKFKAPIYATIGTDTVFIIFDAQGYALPFKKSQLIQMVGGGGGGTGTVTTFSAGALSPLFTTNVTNAPTTPALSFSLSNAAAHKFFGNNTGSTGAPAYVSITDGDLPTGINANKIGAGGVDNTEFSYLDGVTGAIQGQIDAKQAALGFTPENVANKSTNTALGTSNTLYPSQKAVKDYVDAAVSAITIPGLQAVTVQGNLTNRGLIQTGTAPYLSDYSTLVLGSIDSTYILGIGNSAGNPIEFSLFSAGTLDDALSGAVVNNSWISNRSQAQRTIGDATTSTVFQQQQNDILMSAGNNSLQINDGANESTYTSSDGYGIAYNADYSANYNNRSLVDKEYVDTHSGVGAVTSVSGTANRITSTGGTTPVIDISATFEALLMKKANNLSDLANAGTARTNLGLGTAATQNVGIFFQTANNLSEGTPATMRTNLGGTTVGINFFTLTNPSAITFPRINADNSVSALSAAAFRTAIGAGTGSGDMLAATYDAANIAEQVVGLTAIQTLTNKTFTSPVINVTSDAIGDLYYRNGSGLFTRLAIGSSTNVLTVTGGVPVWAAASSGGANALGTYLVQTATNAPANAQVMGILGTGLVKNTTTTGVQSIAVSGTDYLAPTGSGTGLTGVALLASANTFTNNNVFQPTATTGNGNDISTSTITSGNALSVTASGTGATSNTKTAIKAVTSGANATSAQTTYGAQISNTSTGTTSVNVGLYATASGGATNYAAMLGGNTFINASNGFLYIDNISVSLQGSTNTMAYRAPYQHNFYTSGAINFSFSDNQFGLNSYILKSMNFGATALANSMIQTTSFATGYVVKTANYTAGASDYTIECTTNTFQVTLPTAVGIPGRIYTVVNSTAAATITIGTTSSQTFVNVTATPTTLTKIGLGTISVQSNGANWMQITNL